MNLLSRLRGEAFARGIHPPRHKGTAGQPIRRLPFAGELIVPLDQHIGTPARPVVRVGQEVLRGQVLAEADGWLSVPHHAPVTGRVEAIELRPSARGPWTPSIVLHAYAGSTQEVLAASPGAGDDLDRDALLRAIQATGMVGLGGAAFPSHVKMAGPPEARVRTLVINGCECEPYLTCDHRVMVEQADDLVTGIDYALRATGAVQAVIGIEDDKAEAAAAIRQALARRRVPPDIMVVAEVPTKYPQGSEKMLIMALFGVEVPAGGLPMAFGMVVLNVATVAALGRLLPSGQGLIERVVTVAGAAVARPGNYRVPLGTPMGFLLDYAGAPADAREVILGGPMMGQAVAFRDIPVTKGVSGLLVLPGEAFRDRDRRRVYPCIKCGACVEACPMGLNPSQLGLLAGVGAHATMGSAYHLGDCFECGCCSYVCPSGIPLVQQFRVAKQILRERAATEVRS